MSGLVVVIILFTVKIMGVSYNILTCYLGKVNREQGKKKEGKYQ